jgi:hypothetical protein
MRLALILLSLAFATSARADDVALQAQVFGHALGKEAGYACFTRAYDKAHLASHPKQNVTSIMLMLKGTVETQAQYLAGVDFRFRKSGKHFQAYGDCPSVSTNDPSTGPNALHCGIDCDGGTINVNLKDADTILVKLPDSISVSGNGDEDAPSNDRFGSDDKVFKLTRVPVATCVPLGTEDADKAAMKKAK